MLNQACFQRFPDLRSKRLLFRQLTLADAPSIQAIRNHPEVMRYMDSAPHLEIEQSEAFITNGLADYGKGAALGWGIVEKETGAFIGDFAFWRFEQAHARGEIGYTLLPDYWGQGYMKESLFTLLSFGFQVLGLHSMVANVNPENERSKGLLRRLGFAQEAYFRESFFFDGKFLDSEIYCLLEPDLEGAR